ncbi:MAG: hypothetical protein WCG91_00265 [Candidatus Shapirobacteria bacterium]
MTIKKEVSLLPESENPNSLNSRVIKWLTTVGRVVIIFTELIVVTAFASRFWLDRRNADLSEIIRQQQAILNTTKDFENQYSFLQQKLKIIRDFYSNDPAYNTKITSLISSTPDNIVYDNLSLSKDETLNKTVASISLTAYKEDSIVDFITNLMLNPDIQTVNINKIEKKAQENKYSINISLVFKTPTPKT